MRWLVIGIPYLTYTTPNNFETSNHRYEVLVASLLNGEVLNLRSHTTLVKEGSEAVQDRRLDM